MSQINEVQTEFERLQEEFEKQLKELLLGQDWSTAGDLILAQKGKKRNLGVSIPHPHYGTINGLEASIIYSCEKLFHSINKRFPYGDGFTAENHQGFTIGYLAILHNTSFASAALSAEVALNLRNTASTNPRNMCYYKLPVSCKYGHINVAEFVLKKDREELDKPFEGRTPLEIAAMHDHHDMCKFLLSYKPKSETLEHKSDLGNALHIAARFGFSKVVKVLIQEPAEYKYLIEARDHTDMTALGLAVNYLNYEAAKVLLEAGAIINTEQGVKKLTPIQLALSVDCRLREFLSDDKLVREKLVLLLINHGASTEQLTQDQLDYITDIKTRHHLKASAVQEQPDRADLATESKAEELTFPELEEEIPLSTSPSRNTPKKKTECRLCGKKFTSEVSYQAHLRSKGHLKQIRKQKEAENTSMGIELKQQELHGLMDQLPLFSEIFFDVFDRLEAVDLRRFGATCKSFRLIVNRHGGCWQKMVLWHSQKNYDRVADGKTSVFKDVMEQLCNVKEFIYVKKRFPLQRKNDFYQSLFSLARECRKLEVLELPQQDNEQLPISFMNHLFENCPNLRVLRINSIWPFKPSKISAVMAGELDHVTPVMDSQKPKKKISPISDWLVDFKINMPAMALNLEELEMTLFFEEIKISAEQYADFYVGFFKHCPNLKTLTLSLGIEPDHGHQIPQFLSINILTGIMEVCTKLTSLSLKGYFEFGRLPGEDFAGIYPSFARLEKFEMKGPTLNPPTCDPSIYLADHCTNLTSLSIKHTYDNYHTDHGAYSYSKLTCLQHLSLCGFIMDDDLNFLRNITTSCREITSLDLTVDPLDQPAIDIFSQLGTKLLNLRLRTFNANVDYTPLGACTNLTRLQLTGIRTPILHTVIEKMCKLRDLSIKCSVDEDLLFVGQGDIPDQHALNFGTVFESCPQLRNLTLNDAVLTKGSFNNPVVSTSLRVLKISYDWNCDSDLPIVYLSENCPNLAYFAFKGESLHATTSSEHILTTRFPKLETLYLDTKAHLEMMFRRVNANRAVKLTTKYEWKSRSDLYK